MRSEEATNRIIREAEGAITTPQKKAEVKPVEPMNQNLKLVIIVCVSAIAVAWIMQPKRYSIHSGSGTLLLDSSSGNVWRYSVSVSPAAFVRVNKKESAVDTFPSFDSIQLDNPSERK